MSSPDSEAFCVDRRGRISLESGMYSWKCIMISEGDWKIEVHDKDETCVVLDSGYPTLLQAEAGIIRKLNEHIKNQLDFYIRYRKQLKADVAAIKKLKADSQILGLDAYTNLRGP